MSRDLPGFLDRKNALNVARWRLKYALQHGRDLQDLRDEVTTAWLTDNSLPERDWSFYDSPAYLRQAS